MNPGNLPKNFGKVPIPAGNGLRNLRDKCERTVFLDAGYLGRPF